ncbi:hypothetical protein [Kosakonia radicincitans]|uniref:hypothetical protein n=1 Tax=Kosakonia radicincitans TaxID=283686 RepID=UPI001D07654C|nr:hypothetical protein [Kosakonia radicincitans]
MKGNTQKTGMTGFGAYWAKIITAVIGLPNSRQNGGVDVNSPDLCRKIDKTVEIPRGKAFPEENKADGSETRPPSSRQTEITPLKCDGINRVYHETMVKALRMEIRELQEVIRGYRRKL